MVGSATVLLLALLLLSSSCRSTSGQLKTSLEGSWSGCDGGTMLMKMVKAIGSLNLARKCKLHLDVHSLEASVKLS